MSLGSQTTTASAASTPWGVLARFDGPDRLVEAVERLRGEGFERLEAFTPYPVHGLDEALGLKRSKLPIVVFFSCLAGGLAAWLLEWYLSVIEYPLIVAGKPLNSTEAFVPIIFETTILFGAFGAVFGMLAFNRLPRLHHPAFDVEAFARVTGDGFFLAVDAADPKFQTDATLALLRSLGGLDAAILENDAAE